MKRCVAGVCVLMAAGSAAADVVPFAVFENAGGASLSGLNLVVEVSGGAGALDLTFRNDSAIASVVTSIYIEGTAAAMALLSGPEILPPMAGVDFVAGATPPSPAGSISGYGGIWAGNLYSLKGRSPAMANGLSPGEAVTVRFDLSGTVQEVATAISSGQMRLAEHVQGFSGGQSVWAVTVPAPGTAVVLGVVVLVGARRRR